MYNSVKAKWLNTTNGEKFVKYIEKHKKEKLRKNMRADVRTRCGLGNPPVECTQNANGSVNLMVKRAKDTCILTLKDTMKLIQQEVNNQRDKIKLAQIGKGEWRVKHEILSGNGDFVKTSQTYYCMNDKQRKDFLCKFQNYRLSSPRLLPPPTITTPSSCIERQRYK